jgi:hypothetical protein
MISGNTLSSFYLNIIFPTGASMVKWTTLDPCLVFSEIHSKLYTYFEFCEEKNHKHFKNILIYKAKQIIMTKKIQEKSA